MSLVSEAEFIVFSLPQYKVSIMKVFYDIPYVKQLLVLGRHPQEYHFPYILIKYII